MERLTWLPPNGSKPAKSTINTHVALHAHRKTRMADVWNHYQHLRHAKTPKKQNRMPNAADEQYRISRECQVLFALDAGRINPFRIWADEDLNTPYVHEMLDYAVTYMWPQIVPGARTESQNPVRQAWMSSCIESPMTMYSFLHGASENHLLQTRGLGDTKHQKMMRLALKGKAIKLINKDVSCSDAVPSDELLACICTLAVYGGIRAEPKKDHPSPPDETFAKSPLASTETLDVISNMAYVKAHMDALYVLVARKGGLKNVQFYGLAGVLQGCDLLWSSVAMTPPQWLWLLGDAPLPTDLLHATGSQVLGTGFDQVLLLRSCSRLQSAIVQLTTFLNALIHAFEKDLILDYLSQLVKARSKVHHVLLSLPQHGESMSASPDEHALYEIVRISLLLFSFMAVFPLPQGTGIQRQLCMKLKVDLRCCADLGLWKSSAAILLWATFIGTINSSTEEIAWYVLCLEQAADATHLEDNDWDVISGLLSQFIWWDYFCDVPARNAWNAMVAKRLRSAEIDLVSYLPATSSQSLLRIAESKIL